ncbi:hypothetical protein ES703_11433 [subsurface metagenome]
MVLQRVGCGRVHLPARGHVGVMEADPRLLVDVNALHEGGDLLVGHVPGGDAPPPAGPPPVGAVDPVVLLEDGDAVDDLLVGSVDVRVIVEACAHAEAAVPHRLVDEFPHLCPLLLCRVALEVDAHHLGAHGSVADEGGVVDRDSLLLYPLEVLPHRGPVEGPAVDLLHPLVDLLQGIVGLVGVELVGVQVREVVREHPRGPDIFSEGRGGAPALATHEAGDTLHHVVLAVRKLEEAPVGVGMGVYEAGNRREGLRLDDLLGVSLDVAYSSDLVSGDADGPLVRLLARSFNDCRVLDQNVVFDH